MICYKIDLLHPSQSCCPCCHGDLTNYLCFLFSMKNGGNFPLSHKIRTWLKCTMLKLECGKESHQCQQAVTVSKTEQVLAAYVCVGLFVLVTVTSAHCLPFVTPLAPNTLPLGILFNKYLNRAYLSFSQNVIVLKVFSKIPLSLILARF